MKRRLLCLSLVTMSIFGMSCEKNELTSNDGPEVVALDIRGGGGGADGTCTNPAQPSKLMIQKNGQNNGGQPWEGYITVGSDADSISVNYDCFEGYIIKNVSVWIGPKSLAPVNSSGNPSFGQFLIREKVVEEDKLVRIPKSAVTYGDNMIVIAHANVYKHNTESTYGTGTLFTPTGSAEYMEFQSCLW